MRSAEKPRLWCALIFVPLLGACAGVQQALQSFGSKTPAPAASKADASTARSSAAAPAPAGASTSVPPAAAAAPVDPATQRAFDAGRQALAAGRHAEAQRGFEALAKAQPELGGVHANLALIHLHAGRAAEAVAALERAVAASPRQAQFHDQLGIAYRHAGEFAKARAAYERAIALDPAYAPAQLNLAILLELYLWDAPQALVHYERYVALAGDGDERVKRWIADLRRRSAPAGAQNVAARKGTS